MPRGYMATVRTVEIAIMLRMTDVQSPTTPSTRPRWPRIVAVGVFLSLGVVAAMPYVVALSPLRNVVVDRAFSHAKISATATGASFGWFSPLALSDLELKSPRGEPLIGIDRIEASNSWWRLIADQPELGHFVVVRPHIDLMVTPTGSNFDGVGSDRDRKVILSAEIVDGSFHARSLATDGTIFALNDVDVNVVIERTEGGRELRIRDFQPLDQVQLTPDMCRNGLQMIAPVLANAAKVEGSVSLLIDSLQVPLDRPQDTSLSGSLVLHKVKAGLESSPLAAAVGMIGTIMRRDMPSMFRIADQSTILFRMENGRVYHEGLAFGLPDVSEDLIVRTKGWVSLDRTLDLEVELPVPLKLVREGLFDGKTQGKTMQLRVTGTLDDPQIELPKSGSAFDQLLAGFLDTDSESNEPPLASALIDLLGERLKQRRSYDIQGEKPPARPGLLERLRKRRQSRDALEDDEPARDEPKP